MQLYLHDAWKVWTHDLATLRALRRMRSPSYFVCMRSDACARYLISFACARTLALAILFCLHALGRLRSDE
eukprot:6188052-Pleurochrysis_carterae.AAC.3